MTTPVLGIATLRQELPKLIKALSEDPEHAPIVVGSHRNPQAALVPFSALNPKRRGPNLEMLRAKAPVIHTIATAHGFSTVSVIGSVARSESGEDSDVDLLCDATEGVSLFDIAACESDLELLLEVPVTLILRSSLQTGIDETFMAGEIPLC
jgi:predicted nucleotidyltransferase